MAALFQVLTPPFDRNRSMVHNVGVISVAFFQDLDEEAMEKDNAK